MNDIDLDPIDPHYYVCTRCNHMFILRSLIEEFCTTSSTLLEIRSFCDYMLDKNFPNALERKDK